MFATNSCHRIDFFERFAPYYDFALDLLTFGRYAEFQKRAIKILGPLLRFFKLFEKENFNFFSVEQNEILRKAGFKEVETFPVLAGIFQITLAHK